jgi:hypothetical protein
MKNEIRMSLMLVLSFFALIVLGSIEVTKGYAFVWFVGLLGMGGAFLLSLGSLIHMQLIKCN